MPSLHGRIYATLGVILKRFFGVGLGLILKSQAGDFAPIGITAKTISGG
jgi:hypothetical protein